MKAARDLDVPMPVTAATREALQAHFGAATVQADPAAYLEKDFAALIETVALAAGVKLVARERADADRAGDRGLKGKTRIPMGAA